MIRHCQMSGHLAADPEFRRAGEREIAAGRLAVSQGRDKETMWFDLAAWGKYQREALMRLSKGDRVVVAGKLSMRVWTDRNGVPQQGYTIDVDAIEAPRKDTGSRQFEQRVTAAAQNAYTDEDIPF